METSIAVFRGKEIRKTIHNTEWWFSVVDVCAILTESTDPGAYWRKLKQRLKKEGSEVVTFCHGLKLVAPDGKLRKTDCANTEGIFRMIQRKQACCSQGRRGCREGEKRPGTKDPQEGCLPRELSGHSSEKTETVE